MMINKFDQLICQKHAYETRKNSRCKKKKIKLIDIIKQYKNV